MVSLKNNKKKNKLFPLDGNGRIVVADPQNDYFTFWDMSNYNKLYQIKGQNFLEMRISDGTVVFFR